MSKRTLMMVVSLIAAMALAVTGTLAYLTDTDSDVNVMTLGNVDIEQHEMKRKDGVSYNATLAEGDLEPFVDGIKLYPAYPLADTTIAYEAMLSQSDSLKWGPYVHGGTAWNGLWRDDYVVGAVDKMIFVENTGNSDAYVRTIFAAEAPEGVMIGYASNQADIILNMNGNDRYTNSNGVLSNNSMFNVEIDGTRYLVFEYCYSEIMKPGEWTRPSLLQVVMTHWADNEVVELLGDTYDILALSQAVQVENMEHLGAHGALNAAFGEVNVENVTKWFSEMKGLPVTTVSTSEELTAALAEGGTIVLTNDVDMGTEDIIIPEDKEVDLVLSGYTLSGTDDEAKTTVFISNSGTLTISGEGTIDYYSTGAAGDDDYGFYTIDNRGDLTIDGDVTIKNSTADVWDAEGGMQKTVFAIDHKGGDLTINGGTIESNGRSVRISNYTNSPTMSAVFNGGTFIGQVWLQGQKNGEVYFTVNGGEFSPVGNDASSIFITNDVGNNTVAINDGLFNTKVGASIATPIISGGVFATQDAVDKTNAGLFADGYTPVVK